MVRDGSLPPSQEEGDTVAVDTRPPTFTLDDLLAELRPEDAADGLTITEICEEAGLLPTTSNRAKVYRKVKDLEVEGFWECVGKKEVLTSTGVMWRGAGAWRPVEKGGDA